jgi:hypothetical protein
MFMVQAGLFFCVPLFLSIALGLSAIETGVRLLPLSLSLLIFAAGIPRLLPDVSPRKVVRFGFMSLFAGLVLLVGLLEVGSGPEIITWPLLLAGAGLGAMASQLGSITVSSVSDEKSGEVGGPNTELNWALRSAPPSPERCSYRTDGIFFTSISAIPTSPTGCFADPDRPRRVPFVSDAQPRPPCRGEGSAGDRRRNCAGQRTGEDRRFACRLVGARPDGASPSPSPEESLLFNPAANPNRAPHPPEND